MDCCGFWTCTGLACFVAVVGKVRGWTEAIVEHGR